MISETLKPLRAEADEPGLLRRCVIAFGGAWLCVALILLGAYWYVKAGRTGFEYFCNLYIKL